jgi:hypothetical protein
VWFHNTTSLMRSPRLKGPIATLDLRHFPLIEGVVVEDWSNSPRLFRVPVSEHDEGIAEILTGLIQMGAGAGTTVLTVVPETVLEEDFLNLAIQVCEFQTVFAIPALGR